MSLKKGRRKCEAQLTPEFARRGRKRQNFQRKRPYEITTALRKTPLWEVTGEGPRKKMGTSSKREGDMSGGMNDSKGVHINWGTHGKRGETQKKHKEKQSIQTLPQELGIVAGGSTEEKL